MPTIYRATLLQRGATLTPWQADTIFGSLCWAIARREGEAVLQGFLARYEGDEPPLVLSNGFPDGLLPAPLAPRPRREALTRHEEREIQAAAKRLKGKTHLPLNLFQQACAGRDVSLGLVTPPGVTRDSLKNTVSRLGLGTVDEGGLYHVTEAWGAAGGDGAMMVIYMRVVDDVVDLVGRAVREMAQSGYGRRISVGYGQVELREWAPTADLDFNIPDANGFVALSNFCPARDDPTQGYYRTLVKYGRLGEGRSVTQGLSPFKRPLIQLIAGSCFYTNGAARAYYGRLVHGVHAQLDDVVQYGLALVAPAALPA